MRHVFNWANTCSIRTRRLDNALKALAWSFLKAMIEIGGAKPTVAALFNAVYAGNVEGVEAIISSGLSLDSVGNDGETALHVAALTAVNEQQTRTGIAVAKRLVELGASLEARDKDGATARDIVKGGIDRIEAGDLDAEPFDLEELAGLEELLLGPQQKNESRIGL